MLRRPGSPGRFAAWSAALACVSALLVFPTGAAVADVPPGTQCSLPATGVDQSRPWAQQRLDFERVWPITRGAGITVAVVDTGVDQNQPILRNHVLPGPDVINNNGTADTDCVGHGTLIAGIIAGQQEPGLQFAGVAPGAHILPVRQANTTSDGNADTLARGIRAAVDGAASVINVSVTSNLPTPELDDAVHYAFAHNVVVVAAAGNDFQQGNGVQYPAGFPGVLSVGAIGPNGQRASFSESGTGISVVAPGSNIEGPGAGGSGLVTGANGTSYATPFVSGVAALVRSYHPNLTADQVIHRIEVTADHPAGALPNASLGWGVVNPYNAVTAVLPEERGSDAGPVHPPIAIPKAAAPAPPSTTARTAVMLGVGALLLTVLIPGAAWGVHAARRRGWRPGRWGTARTQGNAEE